MVIFINTWHLQQGRTNPEYSIVLHKTYPTGGNKKDSKGMQGYLARGLLHLQEALLKVCSYVQVLLAVIISSLTNYNNQGFCATKNTSFFLKKIPTMCESCSL
jgi:hypothetical protein